MPALSNDLPSDGCHICVNLQDLTPTMAPILLSLTEPVEGFLVPPFPAELATPCRVIHQLATAILPPNRFPLLSLTVTSTIPRAAGLGSSGAFCVAIAGALYQLQYGRIIDDDIFQLAMEGERFFHGSPSGLDHFTSIHGTQHRRTFSYVTII